MSKDKRKGKIILICGPAHSGTTLIDAILGNDPDGFSCGELFTLWDDPLLCRCPE